jgi:hypothetical protein
MVLTESNYKTAFCHKIIGKCAMKRSQTVQPTSTSRRQPHYVVNKRVGDIVQGDKTGDKPLSEVVKNI